MYATAALALAAFRYAWVPLTAGSACTASTRPVASLGHVSAPSPIRLDGLSRPGYDAIRQTISVLKRRPEWLGTDANFVVFRFVTAMSRLAWRASLAPWTGPR